MRNNQQEVTLAYLLIGLAIVVAILIIFLTVGIRQQLPAPEQKVVDVQVEKLQQLSTSDEVATIEKELQDTNLDQIDTELGEVDESLQSL